MSRTRLIIKRGFAVMLFLVLLIGTTACGNSNGQPESVRDTIEQIEDNSGEKSNADLVSEPVTEEPVLGTETEVPENTTDGVGASNILIAYFSRVGNMDFDEDIDAVTSASVNMNGSDVSAAYPDPGGYGCVEPYRPCTVCAERSIATESGEVTGNWKFCGVKRFISGTILTSSSGRFFPIGCWVWCWVRLYQYS